MLANRMMMCKNKRLIDRSIPTTVVGKLGTLSPDISGNGGRRLVRLDDGSLFCAISFSASVYIYKSLNNGLIWSAIAQIACGTGGATSVAMTNDKDNIYVLYNWSDALLRCAVVNKNFNNPHSDFNGTIRDIESTGVAYRFEGVSIAIDTNGNLHAAWSTKNSTYAYCFNIRYRKSADGGLTWTRANGTAGTDQVTTFNSANYNAHYPSIVVDFNEKPLIVYERQSDVPEYHICCALWADPSWNANIDIWDGITYSQVRPCAVVSPDGAIHVVWYGKDSVGSIKYNIFYTKSINNGSSWASKTRLTTGTSYDQLNPSISADINNNIYVIWTTYEGSYGYLKKLVYTTSWGSAKTLATSTSTFRYPSTCLGYKNFTDPLCIYEEYTIREIKFRGVWNE